MVELDYNAMAHAQKIFSVCGTGESIFSYSRREGRQFSLLLAAGFCVGVARPAVLFPYTSPPPSRRFVSSHINRALNNLILQITYNSETHILTKKVKKSPLEQSYSRILMHIFSTFSVVW